MDDPMLARAREWCAAWIEDCDNATAEWPTREEGLAALLRQVAAEAYRRGVEACVAACEAQCDAIHGHAGRHVAGSCTASDLAAACRALLKPEGEP